MWVIFSWRLRSILLWLMFPATTNMHNHSTLRSKINGPAQIAHSLPIPWEWKKNLVSFQNWPNQRKLRAKSFPLVCPCITSSTKNSDGFTSSVRRARANTGENLEELKGPVCVTWSRGKRVWKISRYLQLSPIALQDWRVVPPAIIFASLYTMLMPKPNLPTQPNRENGNGFCLHKNGRSRNVIDAKSCF